MKLKELVQTIEVIRSPGSLDVEVSGISYDSRVVKAGDLFVTWKGTHQDGRAYIDEALKRGAVALCLENEASGLGKVPSLIVEDARLALAHLAKVFYRNPSQDLTVVGVTGTNGKTTVAFLIESILAISGHRPGLLGTIHYKIGDRLIPSERTTPESLHLQAYFREMVDKGCESAVMEVSSHALHQKRVQGINFKGAVFTNLSQDHLDYHRNMEEYFLVKSSLFKDLSKNAFAVINLDDSYGVRLLQMINARPITYGFSKSSIVWADRINLGTTGSFCEVVFPDGKLNLELNLIGRFNIYNALAAFATAWSLGISPEIIKNSLEGFKNVPGRMEFISTGESFDIVVDYAHTQDALHKALDALRPLVKGRIITVFGCGGDRDETKRPKMGEVAGGLSDFVVLTSDNPRTEDPLKIVLQIEAGLRKTKVSYEKILDRKAAIEFALGQARCGDLVLIAGKGHEKLQEIGRSRISFDDVAVVKELAGCTSVYTSVKEKSFFG